MVTRSVGIFTVVRHSAPIVKSILMNCYKYSLYWSSWN